MSSNWIKHGTTGKTSQSTCTKNQKGSDSKVSNKTRRYHENVGKSSEDSTEDEEEVNMMEEIQRAFEKAIDSKFAKIEQRIVQMEEKNDKIYKIVASKDRNDKCSEESLYRDLLDLIENNTEESKQSARTLEALNSKQNDLIENTEDLIAKTSKLQKTVKELQKNTSANFQGPKHSIESSSISGDEDLTKRTNISEINQRIDRVFSVVEDVQDKMDSWVKYSHDNTNRMLEKLTSMAKAVEATTVQEKVMQDSLFQRMDTMGDKFDNSLGALMNDINKIHKDDMGRKQLEELFEQLHKTITETKSNDSIISSEQNLENLSNIMESLAILREENASLQSGINEILNDRLTEDLLQGVYAMMIDNKTILQNVTDKKSLTNINNILNDIKLGDVKINMHMKEIKNMCSTLCEETVKELLDEVKGIKTRHVEVVSDIKRYETERFDEFKVILQRVSKAQTKLATNRKENSPQNKRNSKPSDDASMNSMLLQMEIQKANAEQTKLMNIVTSKVEEISENQTGHHHWMANFRSSVDTDIGSLINKFDSQGGSYYDNRMDKFEDKIQSVFLQQSNTMLEESNKRTNIQSEVLNSIEDLKILTSSMPNTVNDIVPLIEKMGADIAAFPDDVNASFAGLEENLCANLEGSVKRINDVNFKEICNRFDTLGQRLLVIRKYVKHGGQGNLETASNEASDGVKTCSCSIPSSGQMVSNIFERVDNIGNVVEKTLASNETIQREIDILVKLVPSISDIKSQFSDERISLIAGEISKGVSTHCKDTLGTLARADVVEEQIMALADEIMPRIKELKAIEENLMTFCEKSVEPNNQHFNADSKRVFKRVVQLSSLIKNVDESQQQIMRQGDDSIEHQETMSKIFKKIHLILNNTHKLLINSFESVKGLDVDSFLKGCKQLNRKITELDVLDIELRSLTKNDGRSDLQQLVQKTISLLYNIDSIELISEDLLTTKTNENIDPSLNKQDPKATCAITKPIEQRKAELDNINTKPPSNQKHKAPKITSNVESGPIISDVKSTRIGKVKTTKMCSSPNALRPKYTSTSANTELNSPSRVRKRISSISTDDSIVDTNSEAQDQGEIVREPLATKQLSGKMSGADRNGRPWGPKCKRPCYGGTHTGNKYSGETTTIPLPEPVKQSKLAEWQPKIFLEKEFDCSSVISEDMF